MLPITYHNAGSNFHQEIWKTKYTYLQVSFLYYISLNKIISMFLTIDAAHCICVYISTVIAAAGVDGGGVTVAANSQMLVMQQHQQQQPHQSYESGVLLRLL